MNIIPFAGEGLTMSSREIAELTEKRHGDVIRDTRVMLEALGDDADLRHVQETKDSRGYTAEISLPKDLTLTLVSGYNVKLRAAIIDRCAEKWVFSLPPLEEVKIQRDHLRAFLAAMRKRTDSQVLSPWGSSSN